MGDFVVVTPSRPRGRPQRLPYDDSTAISPVVDGNKRLAWLMATSRISGPGSHGMVRAEFAKRLRELGVRADPSRMSRWESGLEYLPPRLVTAYEQVIATPRHSLDAVRRMLSRLGHLEERNGERADESPEEPEWIDDALDDIHDGRMSGSRWLDLIDELQRYDRIYMHQRTWAAITRALVDELARSCGPAFRRRYEAAAAFMALPMSRPHLSRNIGRFALTPQVQVHTPVLSLLSEVADAAASDLILKLVSAPDEALQRSATIVSAAMIARGQLRPDERMLEVRVGRELGSAAIPGAVTIDLATRLDDEQFERVVARTRPAVRTLLHQARSSRELVDADTARLLSERITQQVRARHHRQSHEPDPMLRNLIREAFFHVHRDRRHLATALLLASPYAREVGEAALQQTAHHDDLVAAQSWGTVRRFAPALDASAVAARAEAERRPHMRHRALSAVGWARPPVSDAVAEWLTSIAAADGSDSPDASAAVLALGLSRRHRELRRIADTAAGPTPATWWLGNEGAIHES